MSELINSIEVNYEDGICFDCYSPLHQGHLDVIMKSKKENDLYYLRLCLWL